MAGSAADALSHAVERSKQLLFPLKGEKWFALGFTVFLAQCGEGGYNTIQTPQLPFGSGPTFPKTPSGGPGAELQGMLDELVRAFRDDFALYVALAVGGMFVVMTLSLVVLWLSSRAKLMLVESVVWDRVNLNQQWASAAELGMSLFKFRWLLTWGGGLLTLGLMGASVATGFADFQAGSFAGPRAMLAYALFSFALFAVGFPLGIAGLVLNDFVVPLMVVRNVRVAEAWRMCRREVLSGNVAGLIVFYVLRFVLAIGIAIAMFILQCVTCCLTGIPYLGTVLLLPVPIFWQAFPLYYLEQLGLKIFPAPEPSWAAYDQWRFPR